MVVPTDWKEVRLDEIYEVKSSKRVLQSEWRQIGVPFFRGREVSELASRGKVNNDLFIDMTHYERLRRSYGVPRIDDLLLTAIGTIGNAYRVKTTEPFYFKDASVIWLSGRGGVVGSYVEHWMKSKGFRDQLPSDNGTTVDTLTIGFTAGMRVILPPLKEQEAIAEALNDADAAIESIDALIAKKCDVKQATMQQLLTGRTRLPGFTAEWKEVRLGDLGSTFGGLTGKSSKDFGEGNASFVTFMNVMSNVVLNNQGTEKVRIGNGERQSQLLEGDVIFNGSSETPEEVGFGSAVPIELSGLYLNSFCFGFRRKDTKSLDPKFFAYLTRSPLGRDIIRPMAQGSTRYNIAKMNLLNGRFPLPPLKEQEAIAEALTVMDDELEALNEQVSKLRMVKEGMMQDLLTGKVRLV